MDRILRQWIVALAAGAGATFAFAQALPSAQATPMNQDEALRQYDAARTACNRQPKVGRPECLRNAKDDYDRALGTAGIDSPDIGSGMGGRGGGGISSGKASTNQRS